MVHLLVSTSDLRETEIRGSGKAYDTLDEHRQAFLDKIDHGAATATDMLNFIMLIDDVGYEVIPSSEGMAWMWNHAERFAEIVGDVDLFVEAALRVYEDAERRDLPYAESARPLPTWFFRSFVGSADLVALLSPAWRERYVRELVPRFGTHNDGWIAAVIQNGVPRHVVAQAILERLRRTKVERGIAHAMSGFLRYGASDHDRGSPVVSTLRRLGEEIEWRRAKTLAQNPAEAWTAIERAVRERMDALENDRPVPPREYNLFMHFPAHETPTEEEKWHACFTGLDEWSALSNNELEEALLLCAERDPESTVGYRAKMLRRLDADAVDIIVADAASRLTSLSGVPQDELDRMSLAQRKRLAERFQPIEKHYENKAAAQFLLRLLVELPIENRRAFFEGTVERVLSEMDAASLYAAWRQLGLTEESVEDRLRTKLDAAGYWLGTIERGHHPRGGTQWQVSYPGHNIRYVEDRGSHRYFPSTGDLVMFRYGRHLMPNVVAVTFVPVMKDARD